MIININNEKFTEIEEAFTRLKSNESDIYALRKISDALQSITHKNITVNTVRPESKNQDCMVMSVYPEESTIDQIIDAIVNEKSEVTIASIWNSNSRWTIEIDTRILTRDVDLNEKELTALLLHEVGHIIYSNSIPARISNVMRLQFAKTGMLNKQLLKDNLFSKLLYFPILNACLINRSKSSIRKEVLSDNFSVKLGYGPSLRSAMDKIFIYAGSSTNDDEDMENLMGFSIDSLIMLQKRENKVVRKNIATMIASTPSRFAKNVVNKLYTALSPSRNGGSITESVRDVNIEKRINTILDNFYASEAFFNRVHKLKRIDPLDLDYIGLEINNIKSNDDKMMIVSYIYNKIDTIDYYIELINSKNTKYIIPHSKESLIQMRERLNKYKDDAINYKIPEIEYGVKVMYPTGYDG